MYDRRTVLRAAGAGAAAALAGCSVTGDTATGARTVTDGAGRDVELPESVERVVAVGPGSLRQVAYLGATDRVVGVEADRNGSTTSAPYNVANPDLREKPVIGSVGPNAGGNAEAIIAADPDVIFFYGDTSRAETLQSQTGIPVVALRITDFGNEHRRKRVYDMWRLVGTVLGREDRAEKLATFVEETVADLRDRTADLPDSQRAAAYAGAISYKGAHGIATTRRQFPPFRYAGVENVANGLETDGPSVEVSEEALLDWDPETIFVDADNLSRAREDLTDNDVYDRLAAVENGEVYTLLPHASYHHNYGSVLANGYFVGTTLYPDRFGDVDFRTRVDSIYETMLGAPLYDDLIDTYGAYQRLDDLDVG
ncbi:iron ABC transporter substrate-binding protein [Halapricum desulfuricans]|uniref:ABC-type Fe3+-hydroxamate transport system, periplasmic component n=1 Tax=Halapricum desulfuricans TaxID=2841257 RepID=A0A897N6N1_9EURY|nr:iron ABC transporter substrate-binding protein [Halapricum desulfuricans]QSG08452.1 ABC-type Fe3+-hydroxamate transport system, periplasmic component [Halapricum desulfuricans]